MASIRGWLLLVSAALTVSADPITWTLNDVTSLGTSITGSFVFNADTSTYSGIEISTSGGTVIPSILSWSESRCSVDNLCGNGLFLGLVDTTVVNETGADMLGLLFGSGLTDAGGSVPITGTQQGTCFDPICDTFLAYANEPADNLNVTGTVVASVPEPTSLALFGTVALFLVLMRKRLQHP